MYINSIKLTNNVNTYKQMNFKGSSPQSGIVLTELPTGIDTTQFKSSTSTDDAGNMRNQTLAHKLYRTLTNKLIVQADPYFPINSSSRPFLY
jgi:hypothetical protein